MLVEADLAWPHVVRLVNEAAGLVLAREGSVHDLLQHDRNGQHALSSPHRSSKGTRQGHESRRQQREVPTAAA